MTWTDCTRVCRFLVLSMKQTKVSFLDKDSMTEGAKFLNYNKGQSKNLRLIIVEFVLIEVFADDFDCV